MLTIQEFSDRIVRTRLVLANTANTHFTSVTFHLKSNYKLLFSVLTVTSCNRGDCALPNVNDRSPRCKEACFGFALALWDKSRSPPHLQIHQSMETIRSLLPPPSPPFICRWRVNAALTLCTHTHTHSCRTRFVFPVWNRDHVVNHTHKKETRPPSHDLTCRRPKFRNHVRYVERWEVTVNGRRHQHEYGGGMEEQGQRVFQRLGGRETKELAWSHESCSEKSLLLFRVLFPPLYFLM